MMHITNETIEQIVNLYAEGKSFQAIRTLTGVSTSTISKYLKEANVTVRNRITEKQKQQIVEEYEQLRSVTEVAAKLQIDKSTISMLLNKLGYKTNNKIDEEIIDKIIPLYRSGKSLADIADTLKISLYTVNDRLKKAGFMLLGNVISEYVVTQIIEDYLAGNSSIEVGEKFGVHFSTVIKILYRHNIDVRPNKENSRLYYCNDNYFENIDTPEKAYWLGIFYADGYITRGTPSGKYVGIALASVDRPHLDKLNKCLDSSYLIHNYISESEDYGMCEYSRLRMTSDKMFDDLASQGVVERKTLVIEPPKIADNLRSHFIRGYFDGDGCFTSYIQNGYVTYAVKIVGTEALLKWMIDYIKETCSFEIKRLYKRKPTSEVYNLELHGITRSSAFLNLLYDNADVYLDRKYEKYKEMVEDMHSRPCRKRWGL